MFNKLNILTICSYMVYTLAYNYQLEHRDEEIFLPCPEYPDNFIDKFITMPANVTVLPNDTYYVAGNIEILTNFDSTKNYPMTVEFYKRERGNWQKTIYTVKRQDLCGSLFNPSELWNTVIKELPMDQRYCPFKKGRIFSLDLTAEPSFQMPSGKMEGEYCARFEAGDKTNLKEFCCLDVHFLVFRI